jgi:branched-chain amino acid aminotransferase
LANPFEGVRWIWQNGRLVDFEKATVHVLAHALHYGSGVFEGIRCYRTPAGPAVFRLREHLERLFTSARVYRMEIPWTIEQLTAAVDETILANGYESCYVRPLVYRGLGNLGVNPLGAPVEAFVAAWPMGKYLGDHAESGIEACVSSWRRAPADCIPAVAKATGGYLSSQLVRMEAVTNGYEEGIALDHRGFVSEGSGENLFLVKNGAIVTPPFEAALLPGITRDAVIVLARDLGIPLREEVVPRGQLYTCDELFFTGTAAEVTPIKSVDRIAVGRECPGPITRRLMTEFHAIAQGQAEDRHGWLHRVERPRSTP